MPLDAHATEEEDKLILLSSLSRLCVGFIISDCMKKWKCF